MGPVSLRREPLQTITALATDLAPYGINIQDKTFITFQLKSCKDAFITLVDQNGNETYQFVLGAANNTVISFFTSQNAVYFDYPDGLLSCTEFKSFWLSWEDLNFKVGLGNNTSEGQILSHNETTNGMQFTGFQKIMIHTGFKENGTWIIYNEGKTTFRGTDSLRKYLLIISWLMR